MTTNRDRIWATTLEVMEYERRFTAADIRAAIDTDPPSVRTVRNTLNAMASMGFLESDGGTGSAPLAYAPVIPSADVDPGGYNPRASSQSSPVPYPGSKGGLTDWIIGSMPSHDTYVEVFGGSAAVLLAKPRSKYEIYNDVDEDVTQFFEIVRDNLDELAEWLQAVPYSRSVYEEWVEEYYNGHRPSDPIERAGRWFSIRHMQYIGVSSTPNSFKSRARRSPARSFSNARNRIHRLSERFAEVTIESADFSKILDLYDDPNADVVFYLDPPYLGSQDHYQANFDREAFIKSLQSVENDWLLSCKNVPDAFANHRVKEQKIRHRMKRKGEQITEKLVCNVDSSKSPAFPDHIQ